MEKLRTDATKNRSADSWSIHLSFSGISPVQLNVLVVLGALASQSLQKVGSVAHPFSVRSVRDSILVAGPVGALMHGRNSYTGMRCDGRNGSLFPRCGAGWMLVQKVHSSMNLVLIELSAELKVDPSLHSDVFKPPRFVH